jgi:hypothetical protein
MQFEGSLQDIPPNHKTQVYIESPLFQKSEPKTGVLKFLKIVGEP